jgi:Zn-dependent M28 family amino/carboxypeptidase
MNAELKQLADRLRTHVEVLASVPRPPESRAHQQARRYVRDQLRQNGFAVQAVTQTLADSMPCTNVLTEPVPADEELPLLIVGAHYDSVPGSPGADDNASAVAALLELARWLRPRLAGPEDLRARLQLVAYDLEEYGLLGSYAHASALQAAGQPVRGMLALEMLGYIDARPGSQRVPPPLAELYPDVGNFIGVVGNETSVALLEETVTALKSIPGLPVEFMAVPGNGEMLQETRLSDHSSFWDLGYPALMITDTSFFRNPHYHQNSDTPDTLNYEFLARVTQGVCKAVWQLLK